MELTSLTAVSPIDGRYTHKTNSLSKIFSEYALIRHRLYIEIKWLQFLASQKSIPEVSKLSKQADLYLQSLFDDFSLDDALRVKQLEKQTNHDVKAVEYFLKEKLAAHDELASLTPFIHFACTSEDINNLAYALMLQHATQHELLPTLDSVVNQLRAMALQHADLAMLARTHGQAATPTTLGKELANFVSRLDKIKSQIANLEFMGKFNGAVGNFNAHHVAYPKADWPKLTKTFVESVGLSYQNYSTQIDSHDFIAELNFAILRANTILIDLCRDVWSYISLDYFKLSQVESEVGSSTMPHKVNPIDFENAEGNLGLANSLLDFLARELPTSRFQRDLTDSTLMRNCGVAFAHCLIAYDSCLKGLKKLSANEVKISNELNQHWEVLAEAIQTVLRKYGVNDAYEQMKTLTRGKAITQQSLQKFIAGLSLDNEVKTQLMSLTPSNYVGFAAKLAKIV